MSKLFEYHLVCSAINRIFGCKAWRGINLFFFKKNSTDSIVWTDVLQTGVSELLRMRNSLKAEWLVLPPFSRVPVMPEEPQQ